MQFSYREDLYLGRKGPQLRFPRFIKKIIPYDFLGLTVSATRRRRNIFNIVSIHHGWMQKHDFSVLDRKYSF